MAQTFIGTRIDYFEIARELYDYFSGFLKTKNLNGGRKNTS